MIANAEEARRLHARVRATWAERGKSDDHLAGWRRAAAEFHARYDALAFPGGFGGARVRILAGDEVAMEAAVRFLELRPYFFRSGYMFQTILRTAKRAPQSEDQARRLRAVLERYDEWKRARRERRGG
jgi:hypothetical protein